MSRQTGAMMEQRKVCASGWQPVCNSGLQSSEQGTTSFSMSLWPKKFGSRISEYPTSLQTLIWSGMVTQRVDWLMSNANNRGVMATRATVKNNAMRTSLPSPRSAPGRWTRCHRGCVSAASGFLIYSKVSQPPSACQSVINYLSKRRRVWRQLVLWSLQTEREQ